MPSSLPLSRQNFAITRKSIRKHSRFSLEFKFYLIIALCLFIAVLIYAWDGTRQKRINSCLKMLDQQQLALMPLYENQMQQNVSVFHSRAFCEGI